jgi:hypothetical protein
VKVSELITLLQTAKQDDEILIAYPAIDANGEEFVEYCEVADRLVQNPLYSDTALAVTPIIPPDSVDTLPY